MDQSAKLKSFFSAHRWRDSMDRFPLSGYALVDEINALSPRVVVDVGCGFNPFKRKVPNLIGLDLANEMADLVCDLSHAPFAQDSVDAALALGSINFGTRDDVTRALKIVRGWLRIGSPLFMRANPGEPIGDDIVVFPWSAQIVAEIAEELGFGIARPVQEEHLVLPSGVLAKRLFWIYTKC